MSYGYRRYDLFSQELKQLINKYSMENGSDTPDWILANYIKRCLDAYELTIDERETWYGRKCGNGVTITGDIEVDESIEPQHPDKMTSTPFDFDGKRI